MNNFIPICCHSDFRYVWLVNCSILNMIWMTGLCAALLDCIVCGPFQRILPPSSWNQDKERTFTDISEWVADFWVTTKLYMSRFFNLRQTHTKLVMFRVPRISIFLNQFNLIYNILTYRHSSRFSDDVF